MDETRPKRLTVPYPKSYFYGRTVYHIVIMSPVLAVLALFAGAETLHLTLLAVLFIVYIVVMDLTPTFTDHWLTRSRLIIRQGLLFKTVLPLREVASVERTDETAKVGVKFQLRSNRLFVTSSRANLVLIRLKAPRTFPWALGKRADEIVINVEDREGFLNEMEARLALFPPVETEGSDADLRDEGRLSLVD
jgi:hypothetical protein